MSDYSKMTDVELAQFLRDVGNHKTILSDGWDDKHLEAANRIGVTMQKRADIIGKIADLLYECNVDHYEAADRAEEFYNNQIAPILEVKDDTAKN